MLIDINTERKKTYEKVMQKQILNSKKYMEIRENHFSGKKDNVFLNKFSISDNV